MFSLKNILVFTIVMFTKGDWVEIPQLKPSTSENSRIPAPTVISETKTPVNIIFLNDPASNLKSTTESSKNNSIPKQNSNKIKQKPQKSTIISLFVSTTQFTPLASSINVTLPNPVTSSTPINDSSVQKKQNKKKNIIISRSDGLEVENVPKNKSQHGNRKKDNLENREIPLENDFNYSGFMPFLKSIQSILLQKVHKNVHSKIEVLKNLRDNLLLDIDQRIRRLWSSDESSPRDYKDDSHIEFPSNEGALMTIGFLTLAVFLVKLVLQVIAAIKAKKLYYSTSTTTAASTAGRKKRFISDQLDDETSYRILNLIDTFKFHDLGYN